MYRRQIFWQKIFCFAALAAGAIAFLYSLGLMTDLYDGLYFTFTNKKYNVEGANIYYDMQPFNRQLLLLAIGIILLGCVLFLTGTHKRRKYYIGNYIATGLFSLGSIAYAFWMSAQVSLFKQQFLSINFEQLADMAKKRKNAYIDSTMWFDLHYVVLAVLLLVAILLILNVCWKISLMKNEAALIEAGKAVPAARKGDEEEMEAVV